MKSVSIPQEKTEFKYLMPFAMLFVTVLIGANIAAQKLSYIGPFTYTTATLFFPISYIFGDVLTEVYGYRYARRVIWMGLICNAILVVLLQITIWTPPASTWHGQAAYHSIMGTEPRIIFASFSAIFVGEFVNTYILAKLKVWSHGRHLWLRMITSTGIGVAFDTVIFTSIAFLFKQPMHVLLSIMFIEYTLKLGYEVLTVPITYVVINFLKKSEGMDVYDYTTNFNPFAVD